MAEATGKSDKTDKSTADLAGTYLTFTLGDEEYGIEILKIREIIGMIPITKVPQTPEFVKGVINLRGKVIPVIDLRLRFGMERVEYTERTCTVVLETMGHSSIIQLGIVVDAVSEVISIRSDAIDETPSFGVDLDTAYIMGIAKMEKGVRILLDIDHVIRSEEIGLLEEAA
jgi:purine-binding chemotaxis protein CheW